MRSILTLRSNTGFGIAGCRPRTTPAATYLCLPVAASPRLQRKRAAHRMHSLPTSPFDVTLMSDVQVDEIMTPRPTVFQGDMSVK